MAINNRPSISSDGGGSKPNYGFFNPMDNYKPSQVLNTSKNNASSSGNKGTSYGGGSRYSGGTSYG